MHQENVFLTAPTSSGKTLPAVLLPMVFNELKALKYDVPLNSKVLFMTALNSLQTSMVLSLNALGISCMAVNQENINEAFHQDMNVVFIGPEMLKTNSVTCALLSNRNCFSLKVIDECHLCKSLRD